MPPLEARLGLSYEQNDWSAGALWRLVRAQIGWMKAPATWSSGHRQQRRLWRVLAQRRLRMTEQVKLSVGVDNLFDKAYAEHLNLAGNSAFGFPADPVAINEPGARSGPRSISTSDPRRSAPGQTARRTMSSVAQKQGSRVSNRRC